ncbi:MAG: rubrerythrin [Myxococcota bacterium]
MGTTPDGASLRAIRQAMEIEIGGAVFYAQAAEEITDPEAKTLLVQLRDLEQKHLEQLCSRFHLELDVRPESDLLSLSAMVVYGGEAERPRTAAEVLDLAAELERRARDFFAEPLNELPLGSMARSLYAEFVADESQYLAMLRSLINKRAH